MSTCSNTVTLTERSHLGRSRASWARSGLGRRLEFHEYRSRDVGGDRWAELVAPVRLGGGVRVAVEPQRRPKSVGEEPIGAVAHVVRVRGRVAEVARGH